MVYSYAPDAPKRFQWEANSEPSKAFNCGPTCITQIANFYRDGVYMKIESTRRLVTACCTPTNAWQQAEMLRKRRIPASVREINTLTELHGLVDSGRRPVLIGVLMSRVSRDIRGHPFTGWHAILVLGRAVVNGKVGFWVTDPNFSPPGGIRPDPAKGKRFYPDAAMQYGFIQNSPRYSVVPTSAKVVTASSKPAVKFNAGVNGVNLRTAPDSRQNNVYAVVWSDPRGIRRVNGSYVGRTSSRRALYGTVRGPDGHTYNKLRISGTGLYTYCQSRFMHRD